MELEQLKKDVREALLDTVGVGRFSFSEVDSLIEKIYRAGQASGRLEVEDYISDFTRNENELTELADEDIGNLKASLIAYIHFRSR